MDIEQTEQLIAYLRNGGFIKSDESPHCRMLTGGVSNRTVLVEMADGRHWVVKQALEKLRVKTDWFSDPMRILREAAGLRHLEQLAPPGTITPLVFEDNEHQLLAMQAVPQPHDNWKDLLLNGQIDTNHIEQFAHLLAAIHTGSRNDPGLAEIFSDTSYFESLRLEPYYAFAAKQVPEVQPFLTQLIDDTRKRRLCVVHGDYSPKNILIHQGQLILLDHEVIHFGDPAFDLGFSLTHLLSKAHYLSEHRDQFSNAAKHYWQSYIANGNVLPDSKLPSDPAFQTFVVRHTLACLLARVAGRSPLEYLNETQRKHQQQIVVTLITDIANITAIDELITQFTDRL